MGKKREEPLIPQSDMATIPPIALPPIIISQKRLIKLSRGDDYPLRILLKASNYTISTFAASTRIDTPRLSISIDRTS
jgi:hypothetical protein